MFWTGFIRFILYLYKYVVILLIYHHHIMVCFSWSMSVYTCLFTHVYELDELCSDLKCTVDHVLNSAVAHTNTARAVKHSLSRDAVWEMERAPVCTLQPLICFRVLPVRGHLFLFIYLVFSRLPELVRQRTTAGPHNLGVEQETSKMVLN